MTVQEKARRSFDYQCKQASKCRHEIYQRSCNSCIRKPSCDIKIRIETARTKM